MRCYFSCGFSLFENGDNGGISPVLGESMLSLALFEDCVEDFDGLEPQVLEKVIANLVFSWSFVTRAVDKSMADLFHSDVWFLLVLR